MGVDARRWGVPKNWRGVYSRIRYQHRLQEEANGNEESALRRRLRYWRRKYGLRAKDVRLLWKECQGKCKLCKKELPLAKANVDHCHRTTKVRGLLCLGCNTALGKVEKWGLQVLQDYLT